MPLHVNNEALSCNSLTVLSSANELRLAGLDDGRTAQKFLLRDLNSRDPGWHRAVAKWPGKGNCITAPAYAPDGKRLLIAAPEEFMCYCLSVPDLAVAWKRSVEQQLGQRLRDPLSFGERFIVSSWLGWVACWDVATGNELWHVDLGTYAFGISSDGRHVYVSTKKGLVKLNLETGEVIWTVEIPYGTHAPAIEDGVGYVGSTKGPLHAIDLKEGKVIWESRMSDCGYLTAPAVDKGELYIGAGSFLWAAEGSTGTVRWRFPREETFGYAFEASSAVLTQDHVIIGGGNSNKIWMLLRETGEPVWSYEAKDKVWCNPAVVDGRIIVGGHDGYYYCFENGSS